MGTEGVLTIENKQGGQRKWEAYIVTANYYVGELNLNLVNFPLLYGISREEVIDKTIDRLGVLKKEIAMLTAVCKTKKKTIQQEERLKERVLQRNIKKQLRKNENNTGISKQL